jgi:DUF4097 and DUF4098 domain-containing protein YvlB
MTAKALTEGLAREILSKGRIEDTTSQERVKVETVVPRGIRGGSYQIRYDVRVPPDAQIQASTTNGTVKAIGLSGKLNTSVVSGATELTDIDGEVDAVGVNGFISVKLKRVSAPVRIEMTNGRLALELPSSSKATLSARVVNGGLDVSGLAVGKVTGNRIKTLEAAINGGGPAINVRATNGRISIEGK